jgi:hypothetical protein
MTRISRPKSTDAAPLKMSSHSFVKGCRGRGAAMISKMPVMIAHTPICYTNPNTVMPGQIKMNKPRMMPAMPSKIALHHSGRRISQPSNAVLNTARRCAYSAHSPLDTDGSGFSRLTESASAVFSHLDFYFLILTLSAAE